MPRNAVTTLSIGASRAVLLTLLVIALILVLQRVLGPFYRFIGNVNLFYKKSSSVMKAEIDIAVARDQCAKNYGSVRSFNPNSTAITHPPILYSFPGRYVYNGKSSLHVFFYYFFLYVQAQVAIGVACL